MKYLRKNLVSALKIICFISTFALVGCSDSGNQVESRTGNFPEAPKKQESKAYEEDRKKFRAVAEAQEKENERRAAEAKKEYEELLEREKRQQAQ